MKYDTRKFFEPVLAALGGFFRLETKDDQIKQVYSGFQFSICQRELISIGEVPNIDTTLRSVATAQSCGTGQGFKKCSSRFHPNFERASHLFSPSTNLTRGLAARWLFEVPSCREGTIHLQTSMSSPGFEPRPNGTAVSVANHCTG
ncbi:hypothetical protein TNCV_2107561 [Trichonephila clavipes]|nr:hypothetical protein TNCV_2107561 [Trichonephila clavipes]